MQALKRNFQDNGITYRQVENDIDTLIGIRCRSTQ